MYNEVNHGDLHLEYIGGMNVSQSIWAFVIQLFTVEEFFHISVTIAKRNPISKLFSKLFYCLIQGLA